MPGRARKPEIMTAAAYFPERLSLTSLREAARGCQACELWKLGTQTVFGEGRKSARVFLIGEQPGNDEDLAGRPFVGPAGRVLDEGLAAAGIDRSDTYVTNVVKHFKWIGKGKRRLHKTPNAREIGACLPWLESEIEMVKPEVLICLGATAAQTLLGRDFRVSRQRGQIVESILAPYAMATVHPSSILRQQTSEARHAEMGRFIEDLHKAAEFLRSRRKSA